MRRAFRKSLFGLLYLFAFIKHCTVYIVRVVIRGGGRGEAVVKVEGFVEVGQGGDEVREGVLLNVHTLTAREATTSQTS